MHYIDSVVWRLFKLRSVAYANNTREVSHARGACAHARTFQGTGLGQIDSFLVEREC